MDDVAGLAHVSPGDLGIGHAYWHSPEHHHEHHSHRHGHSDRHDDTASDGVDQGSSSVNDLAHLAGEAPQDSHPADTGGNEAGNGGNGTFMGAMLDMDIAIYMPINIAIAGYGGTATATQTNWAYFDQGAHQLAGIGGSGGDGNTASGGDVLSLGGPTHGDGSTGGNAAGNGGDGTFLGVMNDSDVAVFMPVNIAIAGYGGTATATQTNWAYFNQGATQIGGIGGSGGNGNTASGGDVLSLGGPTHGEALTGHDAAGTGGDGSFLGALVDNDIAIYAPINIAIAGYGGVATATQTNWAGFNQGATQIAGLGGGGGDGNTASGGDIAGGASLHGATDVILALLHPDDMSTGHGAAGTGGDGIFAGFMNDLDHALFNPINVADGSHTVAHQSNWSLFGQGALQIAGIGGDGGDLNSVLGGDVLMHLFDAHLIT
jgi:hypothetical protein